MTDAVSNAMFWHYRKIDDYLKHCSNEELLAVWDDRKLYGSMDFYHHKISQEEFEAAVEYWLSVRNLVCLIN